MTITRRDAYRKFIVEELLPDIAKMVADDETMDDINGLAHSAWCRLLGMVSARADIPLLALASFTPSSMQQDIRDKRRLLPSPSERAIDLAISCIDVEEINRQIMLEVDLMPHPITLSRVDEITSRRVRETAIHWLNTEAYVPGWITADGDRGVYDQDAFASLDDAKSCIANLKTEVKGDIQFLVFQGGRGVPGTEINR